MSPGISASPKHSKSIDPYYASLLKRLEQVGFGNQYAKLRIGADVDLSAHAHLYQRITYQHADGREIPHLIIGTGGHSPIENLFETYAKRQLERRPPALHLVLPPDPDLRDGDTAKLVAYNDTDFGFARITVDINQNTLTGEFFTAFRSRATPKDIPGLADTFVLDLKKHALRE